MYASAVDLNKKLGIGTLVTSSLSFVIVIDSHPSIISLCSCLHHSFFKWSPDYSFHLLQDFLEKIRKVSEKLGSMAMKQVLCYDKLALKSAASQVQYSTAQHSTAQHSTAQHSTAQHSTAQHSTAQHSTAQHSTAQHSTAQHSTVQLSLPTIWCCFQAVQRSSLTLLHGVGGRRKGDDEVWYSLLTF